MTYAIGSLLVGLLLAVAGLLCLAAWFIWRMEP